MWPHLGNMAVWFSVLYGRTCLYSACGLAATAEAQKLLNIEYFDRQTARDADVTMSKGGRGMPKSGKDTLPLCMKLSKAVDPHGHVWSAWSSRDVMRVARDPHRVACGSQVCV